jgi:acetyl esterase/lipase
MRGCGVDRIANAPVSMRTSLIGLQLIAWLGVIAVSVWAWRTPPIADRPDWSTFGISLDEGRVYRTVGSRRVMLDVYRPTKSSNAPGSDRLRPAVLAIHGGAWIGGSRAAYRYDTQKIVARLAERGLVVFAIDYRLATPGSSSWPSVLDDLREAVRWLRRHSGEFGIDPGRIAVMGQSSGGHLASLLAMLPEEKGPDGVSSQVQAVVSLYGPSDLPSLVSSRHLAHEPAYTFLGDASSGPSNRGAEASPIEHVSPGDPPTLLIHGADDGWVPLDQSVRMAKALDRAGVPHRLIVVAGVRHGFETLLEDPVNRDLLPEIIAFLETVWKERAE